MGKLLPVLHCPARRVQGCIMLSLTAGRTAVFVPLFAAAGRLGAGPGVFLCLAFGLAASAFYEGARARAAHPGLGPLGKGRG
jgi:hypothetical protein